MTKVNVVFLGRVELATAGKLGALIIPTEALDALPDRSTAPHSPLASCFGIKRGNDFKAVGAIYEIEATVDPDTGKVTQYAPRSIAYRGAYPAGESVVAGWQAADQAVGIADRARKAENYAADNTALKNAIEVMRFAVRNVAPQHRTAFRVWLMMELGK